MKTRDTALDLIRIVACLMVVLMHSPVPSANANGPFLSALSYFTAPCIGLFFMVSGALLMPVKDDYATFLRRRLSKIVVPTVAWTAVYLGINACYGESETDIVKSLLSVPFSAQGNGVLWFMYTLTGLYLLAPILSAWVSVAKERDIKIVLLLWAITLCFPLIEGYVEITTGTTGILYYFTGYAGYFLLGYYLKHHCRRPRCMPAAVIAAIGLALIPALKYLQVQVDFYRLFWYESVFVAALCIVVWSLIDKMQNWGGWSKHYHRIVKSHVRGVFGPHTRNALLALESGLDFGHPQLCGADFRSVCNDCNNVVPYSCTA